MANENQMAVAQTNTVEPSQANKVVNNIDKISDTQTPVSVLQSDKAMYNQDLKNSFFNSEAWKQYTSNELRKLQPNIFPGFTAIEKAAENPIWRATIDRYGDAVATRQQAIHSSYAKANGALGRFAQAYNAQRYGLRASAARKDLSDALMSGDEVKISEARHKYQNELKNQYESGYAYDDETANTLMSLLASSARNWETIPIEIIGALAIPFTGGGSEVAARAINTAIVGADTYRLETGGALEQIDRLGIDMTEEQKREKSIPVGALNAAIEAGLFSMGGNIAGAGTRYIGTKVAKRTFKKGLEKRLGREISEEAANRLYQIKFLSELQKSTAKEGLGQVIKEFALDGAGEGLQEVVQDTNTNAMISAIQNNTSWGDELGKEWASFAANPFAPEHAEKWKTFFNVMITSPVLGAAYRGVGAATDLAFKGNKQKKTNEMKTKFSGAYNNTLGLSRLFDWHKDGDAKSAIGAANAALQEAINTDPNVTGKLYTTVEQVQEMQKDPEVAQALAQMGVEAGLQQAAENGGVVELDLIAYDKIVNEKQNTVLFQKMRNYLSFSETTMSMNEFNQFIKTNSETITQQISEEVKNNADSIYNKVRNMFLEAGEQQSVANAYAAMAHIMLTGAQGFTQGEKNDILDRLTISVSDGKGGTITRRLGEFKSQTPTTTQTGSFEEYRNSQAGKVLRDITDDYFLQNSSEIKVGVDNLNDNDVLVLHTDTGSKAKWQVHIPSKGEPYFSLVDAFGFKPTDATDVSIEELKGMIDKTSAKVNLVPADFAKAVFDSNSQSGYQNDFSDTKGVEVNVGGMVDNTFADQQAETTTEATQEQTEEQKEENATAEIVTSSSATVGQPVDIVFDVHDRDSNFENNFKKDGTIKETVKKRINEIFSTRTLSDVGGALTELYKLIGNKKDKWIANDVKSTEIVDFANKYKLSPNAVYRAVNIARGKPEARVKVVMPNGNLTKEERDNIINYFVNRDSKYGQGEEIKTNLDKLTDYELQMLYELDPILLFIGNMHKDQIIARFDDRSQIYVEKQSLEKKYVTRLGGVNFSFGKSNWGTWHLWGNMNGDKTVRSVMDFDSEEEMNQYRDTHNITEITNEVINAITGKAEERLRTLNEGIKREGKDYRNGKDVSIEDIQNRFGFRTVGWFGVTSSQGQKFLNSLYDSFSTMADMLGVPYSAMSLSGTLGITTNNGRHRSSSAWYDPSTHNIDFVVTKDHISQAVAHEWWHALDNYLARGSTESLSYSGAYATAGHSMSMREEVRNDMTWLMHLRSTAPGFVNRTVNAPSNPKYWSEATERGARMFEQYVADKLAEKSEYDNLLTKKPEQYSKDAMYLTDEEKANVFPYFDKLFKDLKTEQTESGKTRLYQRIGNGVYHMAVGTKDAGFTEFNQDGSYNIVLTPDANVVTFAHELFHVFSLELQRVYNSGNITDYWRKQAEKLYKIAGVNTATDSDVVLTEAQEEHLANMFTTFLMRGKLENKEVRGLLSKLILMFKDAYKQLEGQGLTALAVDSYAREFFDSLFMLEEDMTEIQRAAGLIAIEKPENVDRELYDFYVASIAESAITASNELNRKLYAIKAFKQNKKGDGKYKQLMDKYKDEARKELMQTDEYQVIAISNEFQGDDKLERTFEKVQLEMPEANLSMGDVANMLKNTKPLEQEVNRLANAKMDAYIAKEFKLTPQELNLKEDRNRAKVRALIAEDVMRKGGKLSDLEAELKKAEDAADKHMGNISVYQIIDEEKWKGRESASVDRYLWAKKQGREDLMAAERFNQAVINLIMIKGRGFKSEYDKMTDLFKKLQSRQRKYEYKDENGNVLGNEFRYNAVDWELLRSISANFGNKVRDPRRSIKSTHQQLREWIDLQVAERFTTVKDLEAYMPFIDRGSDKSLGAMKGKDFKRLYTVMNIIDSVASREQYLFVEGQYARMREFVEQTIKFHNEMNIKTDENATDWYRKFFGRYGTWQNPEPLLRAIFPPEVFQKIFLPLFNGGVTAEYTAKLWQNKWNEAKAKINTTTKPFVLDDGTQITYKDGSFTKVMSYADVADLLLAMGANHAYENYKLKFGLTDEQAQMIASQALARNKNYAEFMNTTWSVYGDATKLLNESFQERTNELFVKKDHRAFEINGIKFEGGYVPEDKHYEALVREMGSQNTGVHNKKESKNEKLITKSADGQVMSIIDITELKLSQSAKWAFASVPFNNVKKFIENEDVKAAMGSKAYKFIVAWLQNYDMPHFDISGVWRPLNNLTTVAALGLKASTAVLQLSGIVQSVSTIGTKYTARGALQFIRENGFFRPFALAKKKSVGLAQRLENPFSAYTGIEGGGRSFKDILNSYNAKTGVGKFGAATLAAFQRVALWPIQLIDGYVAIITWNGAYTRAIEQGMSETEAKAEADSVVRVTQSDASQISRSAALQEPSARAITAFGTWFMAMRSQTQALTTSKKYRADLIQWVVGYAVVGTFIEALLDETLSGDDDDEDKKTVDKIINTWYNKIAETIGGQVMPFAGLGSSITKSIAASVLNDDDDKVIKSYAGGSVAALQYAWRLGDTFARGIKYARTGEEEDRNKFLISASSALSNSIKKQVKRMLED